MWVLNIQLVKLAILFIQFAKGFIVLPHPPHQIKGGEQHQHN